MSVLQKLRDLFRRSPPTAEELEGAAEAHRIRDDMETARLSQRSTAGENYQSAAAPANRDHRMSDVVDRVLSALNLHDMDAFIACYAEGATIEDGRDEVIARGHDGLRERYGPMFELFPAVRVEALSRTDVGDFVVQEERVTGRGEPTRHVAVYLVRDGVIARERLLA